MATVIEQMPSEDISPKSKLNICINSGVALTSTANSESQDGAKEQSKCSPPNCSFPNETIDRSEGDVVGIGSFSANDKSSKGSCEPRLTCNKNAATFEQFEPSFGKSEHFSEESMDEDLSVYNEKALSSAGVIDLKDADKNCTHFKADKKPKNDVFLQNLRKVVHKEQPNSYSDESIADKTDVSNQFKPASNSSSTLSFPLSNELSTSKMLVNSTDHLESDQNHLKLHLQDPQSSVQQSNLLSEAKVCPVESANFSSAPLSSFPKLTKIQNQTSCGNLAAHNNPVSSGRAQSDSLSLDASLMLSAASKKTSKLPISVNDKCADLITKNSSEDCKTDLSESLLHNSSTKELGENNKSSSFCESSSSNFEENKTTADSITDHILCQSSITSNAVGKYSSTSQKEGTSLCEEEGKFDMLSMTPTASPETDKIKQFQSYESFPSENSQAVQGILYPGPKSSASFAASQLDPMGQSAVNETSFDKPMKHKLAVKRPRLQQEDDSVELDAAAAQNIKWVKIPSGCETSQQNDVEDDQKGKNGLSAEPEYPPAKRKSLVGKKSRKVVEKLHNSNSKKGIKKRSNSERPSFTLNNWSAIRAKVRQSLRIPKFKVNHDFVTCQSSDPAHLLQRRPSAGDQLDKASAVERFTRMLDLIARDEKVLLQAAGGDGQLQQMLLLPPPDIPFVAAPKDSEISSALDDMAVTRPASQGKYSIFTPKVSAGNKYPIHSSVAACGPDAFDRMSAICDVKVSLDRRDVLSSIPKQTVTPHVFRTQDTSKACNINENYYEVLEADEKSGLRGKINPGNKSGREAFSRDCNSTMEFEGTRRKAFKEDYGTKASSVGPRKKCEAKISTIDSSSMKADDEDDYESSPTNFDTKSNCVTPESYSDSTALRRSSRTPKVKRDEDFITWTEPPPEPGSDASEFPHSDADGFGEQKQSGTNTRLTLRKTGSQYEVVHASVRCRRQRSNSKKCRVKGSASSEASIRARARAGRPAACSISESSANGTCSMKDRYFRSRVRNACPAEGEVRMGTNKTKSTRRLPAVTRASFSSPETCAHESEDFRIGAAAVAEVKFSDMTAFSRCTSGATRSLSPASSSVPLPTKSSSRMRNVSSKTRTVVPVTERKDTPSSSKALMILAESRSVSSSQSRKKSLKRYKSSVKRRKMVRSTFSDTLQPDELISSRVRRKYRKSTLKMQRITSTERVYKKPTSKIDVSSAGDSLPPVRRSARERRVSVKLFRDGVPMFDIFSQSGCDEEDTTLETTSDGVLCEKSKSSSHRRNLNRFVKELRDEDHPLPSAKRRCVETGVSNILPHPQSFDPLEGKTSVIKNQSNRVSKTSHSVHTRETEQPAFLNVDEFSNPSDQHKSFSRANPRNTRDSHTSEPTDLNSKSVNGNVKIPKQGTYHYKNNSDEISSIAATSCELSNGEVRDKQLKNYSECKNSVNYPQCSRSSCINTCDTFSPRQTESCSNRDAIEDTSNDCVENSPYLESGSSVLESTNVSFGASLCYTYDGESLVQVDASEAFIEPLDSFNFDHRQSLSLDDFSRVIPDDALKASLPLATGLNFGSSAPKEVKLTSSNFSPIVDPRISERPSSCEMIPAASAVSRASNECSPSGKASDVDSGNQNDKRTEIDMEKSSENKILFQNSGTSKIVRNSLETLDDDEDDEMPEDHFSYLDTKTAEKHSRQNLTVLHSNDEKERPVPEDQSSEVAQLRETVSSTTSTPQPSEATKSSRKTRPRTLFCDRCPFRSRALSYFAIHKSQHAAMEERDASPADALVSDLVFDDSTVSHLTATGSLLRCPLCTYATVFKASFTLHRKHHEKFAGKPSFVCPFCICFTFSKAQLASHIQVEHGDQTSTPAASALNLNSLSATAPDISPMTDASDSVYPIPNGVSSSQISDSVCEPDQKNITTPETNECPSSSPLHNDNNSSIVGHEVEDTCDDVSESSVTVEQSQVPSVSSLLQLKTPDSKPLNVMDEVPSFNENSNDFDGFLPDEMTPLSDRCRTKFSDGNLTDDTLTSKISSSKNEDDCSSSSTYGNNNPRDSNAAGKFNSVFGILDKDIQNGPKLLSVSRNRCSGVSRKQRRARKFVYKQRKCPYCGYRCRYVSQYCAHLCTHEDYTASEDLLSQSITEPVVPEGATLVKCAKCRFATNVPSALTRHMRFHVSDEHPQKSGDLHCDSEDVSEHIDEEKSDVKEFEPLKDEAELLLDTRDQLGTRSGDERQNRTEPTSNIADGQIFSDLASVDEEKQDAKYCAEAQESFKSSTLTMHQEDGTEETKEIKTEDENISCSSIPVEEESLEHNSNKSSPCNSAANENSPNTLEILDQVPYKCSVPLQRVSTSFQTQVPEEVTDVDSGEEDFANQARSPSGRRDLSDDESDGKLSKARPSQPDQKIKSDGKSDQDPEESISDGLLSNDTLEEENGNPSSEDVPPLPSSSLNPKNRKVKTTFRRYKSLQTPATPVGRILKRSTRFRRKKVFFDNLYVEKKTPKKRSYTKSPSGTSHFAAQLNETDIPSPSQQACDDGTAAVQACENTIEKTDAFSNESKNEQPSMENQSFNCEHCHFVTDSRVVYSYHMRKHAPKEEQVDTQIEHSCPHCDFKSANKSFLKRHIALHFGENDIYQCPHCSYKTSLGKNYREHVNNHRGKRFSCPKCSYSSAYKACYKRHLLTHDSTNLLHCGHHGCNFSTFRNDVLRMHRATHVSDKKFKCALCPYQTAASYMLKLHMTRHTGEGMLQCPYCTFETAKRVNLHNHVRCHTGQGRLDCKVEGCTYFCFRIAYYRKHLLKHHGIRSKRGRPRKT